MTKKIKNCLFNIFAARLRLRDYVRKLRPQTRIAISLGIGVAWATTMILWPTFTLLVILIYAFCNMVDDFTKYFGADDPDTVELEQLPYPVNTVLMYVIESKQFKYWYKRHLKEMAAKQKPKPKK